MLRQIAGFVSWILLLAAIGGIFYPVFEGQTITSILVAFFHPEWTYAFFIRWLLVLSVAGMTYILIVWRIFRDAPITIVGTSLTVRYDPKDHKRVTISRDQVLRANRGDVTAYFGKVWPESEQGEVLKDSIVCSVSGDSRRWNDTIEKQLAGKGYELIHDFGQPLPHRWYMPLIPAAWLGSDIQRLPRFIRNNLVIRHQSATYLNEYELGKAAFSYMARVYPQHYTKIEIQFPYDIPKGFKARRIMTNGAVPVNVQHKPNDRTVVVNVDRLHNETVRINW